VYTFRMTSWELHHNWNIVRYLVYYLIENLVPPEIILGKDVIDFSAGLGDLSKYLYDNHPKSLTSTSPDGIAPDMLGKNTNYNFIPNLPAQDLSKKLRPSSADLFVARMVFQFPTEQQDKIDVDGMLNQIFDILRPGGEIIICSHEFTQLSDLKEDWDKPLSDYLASLPDKFLGERKQEIIGLIELIETIGLPPREGVHGQTGFGLKGIMMIDSFVRAGFRIKTAGEIEDFTFPVGISNEFPSNNQKFQDISEQVFAIKQKHILSPNYQDKYLRPSVLKTILSEINLLHNFVSVPIFKIHAIKI
jgi:hypothetical protein